MTTRDNVSRPLGMLEKLYTARQALGVYSSVIVTATYDFQLTSGQPSLQNILGTAIRAQLRWHPALSCYFDGEKTPNPVFRRLSRVEIQDVLQVDILDSHISLAKRLQDLHDRAWSFEQKPLWKLIAIQEPKVNDNTSTKVHLCFSYHHVLGDGLSGVAFHTSLYRELQNLSRIGQALPEAPSSIDIPPTLALIVPIETLTAFPLTWWFLLSKAAREYIPRWLIGSPAAVWAGTPFQPVEQCPQHSRVRILSVQPSELQTLLTSSRTHNVTLTSLTTSLIVFALATAIPSAPQLHGTTPYTLRRITGTSMGEIVNQTTGLETDYLPTLLDRIRKATTNNEKAEIIWTTAQQVHSQMQAELAKCPLDNPVGLLPYVTDHIKYYRKKLGRARESTWELSNIGVFEIPGPKEGGKQDTETWMLKSMTFSQGAQPLGPAFSVNCATVEGGPLTITISWQNSVIEERIVDALQDIFLNAAQMLQ